MMTGGLPALVKTESQKVPFEAVSELAFKRNYKSSLLYICMN